MNITIKELLANKIKKHPNRSFIKYKDKEYIWLDIEKASQIIANDLYNIGVREGSHVGLCGLNSINWILTFFAINKLNAVSVLLNPSFKPREIITFTSIADVEFLCCGDLQNDMDAETFINDIKADNNNKIEKFYLINEKVDFTSRFNLYDDIKNLYNDLDNADMSKVFLFTSGSTGVPKVAMHSSRVMVYRAYRYIEVLDLKSTDIYCMVMPLFHIFALDTMLLTAAVSDAKIVIPNNLKTSTIIKTIKENNCSHFNAVPTMMLALISNEDYKKEDIKTLKLSMIAGAVTSPKQLKMFAEAMPNNTFINIYGLSEFAPCTNIKYKPSMDYEELKTVGKPYKDIEIKIQNYENKSLCKKGEVGEVLIRGYGAMMGYYNLPKENQAIDDDGWLHTGDLGYFTNEGNLCISGRIKEIIIRGGENIMPLEVASVIEKYDYIKEVKVIGVPDEFRGEEIAACIVLKNGYSFNEDEIRKSLNTDISKHKIPKYFIIYDELPKLSNGKIDVIKLKKEVENKVCSIFNESS